MLMRMWLEYLILKSSEKKINRFVLEKLFSRSNAWDWRWRWENKERNKLCESKGMTECCLNSQQHFHHAPDGLIIFFFCFYFFGEYVWLWRENENSISDEIIQNNEKYFTHFIQCNDSYLSAFSLFLKYASIRFRKDFVLNWEKRESCWKFWAN